MQERQFVVVFSQVRQGLTQLRHLLFSNINPEVHAVQVESDPEHLAQLLLHFRHD